DTTLRCALRWPPGTPTIPFVDDGRLQKPFHQREHRAVDDTLRHRLHQAVVRNRVEVGGDISVDDPAHARLERLTDGVERIVRRPSRPDAKRIWLKVRFEAGFQK